MPAQLAVFATVQPGLPVILRVLATDGAAVEWTKQYPSLLKLRVKGEVQVRFGGIMNWQCVGIIIACMFLEVERTKQHKPWHRSAHL